jgi:photosystem II oxygen-evolving enhancer protein 1
MRAVFVATCSGTALFSPVYPQTQVATPVAIAGTAGSQYMPLDAIAVPSAPPTETDFGSAAGICALVVGAVLGGKVVAAAVAGKDEPPLSQPPAEPRMSQQLDFWKAGLAAVLACGSVQSASAGPFTRSEIASLTYEQIKGTGLANTCPRVEGGGSATVTLQSGKKYKIDEFCLEPTSFQVIEERMTKNGLITEPVNTKVTTRQTYVLTGIEGNLDSDGGKIRFTETDGIDYAATTVQLPGGERVPFLFTVKNLVAKSEVATNKIEPNLTLGGSFKVPSYRTGLFLDPKGRGTTTGYDQAVALPALQAGGDEGMFKENNKTFDVLDGNIDLKVTSVNAELQEIGGVFVSQQPSDTDLGSKVPKQVLLKGNWFGTVIEE